MPKFFIFLAAAFFSMPPSTAQQATNVNENEVEVNTNFNPAFLSPSNQASVPEVELETKPIQQLLPYPMDYTKGLIEACQQVMAAERGEAYDLRGYGLCEGYMRGVKNTYDMQRQFGSEGKLCFPKDITWLDLIRTFLRWSEVRRAEREQIAWVSLITAFSRAYPCP